MRRLDVAAEVARRYVDVVRREALVALGHDNAAVAARIVDTVRARLAAARASRAEVAKAEIALNRAAPRRSGGQWRVAQRPRDARAFCGGRSNRTSAQRRQDLYRLPKYESIDALVARLEQNPDLMRVRLASAPRRRARRGWRNRRAMPMSVGAPAFAGSRSPATRRS